MSEPSHLKEAVATAEPGAEKLEQSGFAMSPRSNLNPFSPGSASR